MKEFLDEINYVKPNLDLETAECDDKFPIEKPTFFDAKEDFEKLCSKSFADLLKDGQWSPRYDGDYLKKLDYYIDMDRTGLISSNYFHFEARMCCNSINSPSPIRNWYNEKFKGTLYNSKYAEKSPKTALHLRKYVASQFRPSACKCLLEIFDVTSFHDPCMGWGDRLSAFLATEGVQSYSGTDVNPHLFFGYEKQCKSFLSDDKTVNFNLERAEDHIPKNQYDFAFTSPPYFNIEKYEGMWQSSAKYKKVNDWRKKFLFKMFDTVCSKLVIGGHFLLNISDVYSNHTINRICQPLIEHATKKSDISFLGSIGYRMNKRPNSKAEVSGTFAEPVLIFKKH